MGNGFLNNKILKIIAFFLIGLMLSLSSSFIVINLGCGSFRIVDCGLYAGWPVPYLSFNKEFLREVKHVEFMNPTVYYKNKLSPLQEDKIFAEKFLSDGIMLPFFLQDFSYYDFNPGLFLANFILWLLPAGFIIGVFF